MFGLLFAAVAVVLLLAFVFRAEIPELDWASDSVRSLIELPKIQHPEYPALAQPAAGTTDAGVSGPDAMVSDIGAPVPMPPAQSAMERGQRLLEAGDAWKALLAFEEAKNSDPQSAEPIYYMGTAYLELGKRSSALAMFQRYLELSPEGPNRTAAAAAIEALSK